jgi:nucleotide-binding universal stress UspA family protein
MGLEEAIKLAKLTGAELRLVHVVDVLTFATGFEPYGVYASDVLPIMREEGWKILNHAMTQVRAHGVKVDGKLFDSLVHRVSDTVVEQARAWAADLIVIGTHGRRGIQRLMLGSDAEQILRTAPVPVLLVRSTEASGNADNPTD